MATDAEKRRAEARHESFLVHADYRFIKLAVLLCAAAITAYAIHDPAHGPAGNTWLGYTLGGLSLTIVLWLSWLGIRKRSFRGARWSVKAWTSAHVYLGLSLVVLTSLHSGFQFDYNIHTGAYGLLLLVVASGIYGVAAYGSTPARITRNRKNMEFRAMLAELERLDAQALSLAERVDEQTYTIVTRSISRAPVGGGVWAQLSGRYQTRESRQLDAELAAKQKEVAVDFDIGDGDAKVQEVGTIAFMADQIFDRAQVGGSEISEDIQQLLHTIAQRKELVRRINRDITLRARMTIWLFVHVPATVALLLALSAHVFFVFYYR